MSVKLLTEHHLVLLSLKGGCIGSSESTLVKMSHCWKSHVSAHIMLLRSLPFDVIQPMVFCWDVPVYIVEICRVNLNINKYIKQCFKSVV